MNLSLEAYDWWATQIPAHYRTLETNSKYVNFFESVNNGKGSNIFDAYIQVWV